MTAITDPWSTGVEIYDGTKSGVAIAAPSNTELWIVGRVGGVPLRTTGKLDYQRAPDGLY
jgi:hypothetical protein